MAVLCTWPLASHLTLPASSDPRAAGSLQSLAPSGRASQLTAFLYRLLLEAPFPAALPQCGQVSLGVCDHS